jgi:hypothetical protein
MKRAMLILAAASAVSAGAWASSARADNFTSQGWTERTFNSTGVEGTNAFGAPTATSSEVVGSMPTDSVDWAYSNGGGQGYEAVEHLYATSGSVVGNLSGKTGMTATFSLDNSSITPSAAFITSDFGGELNGTGQESENVLLYFRSSASDPGDANYGNLSSTFAVFPASRRAAQLI